MPAATSYTEETLAAYMRTSVLRETADTLAWTVVTVPGDYDTIIHDVERYLGVDDIASVESARMRYVELVAAYFAWKAAVAAFVTAYDIAGGGATGNALARTMARGQMFAHAQQALADAADELEQYERTLVGVDQMVEAGTRSAAIRVRAVWRPR
jgi:hypothetical protein